jgi:hypothetical protein
VITEIHGNPDTYPITVREKRALRFDVSGYLGQGQTINSPAASLTRLDTGASAAGALVGAPSASGTYLTQTIDATLVPLVKGVTYRLSIRFTDTAGNIWDALLDLPVRD